LASRRAAHRTRALEEAPTMKIHYYLVCARFEALVASHLGPEDFGLYMAVGTSKLSSGRVMFFEVDGEKIDREHFRLHDIEDRCKPHPDGSPKRSKYVSVYRVMEFIPLPAYMKLYLTTSDGRVLGLSASEYDGSLDATGPSLYRELCPLYPLVVSGLAPREFCKAMTDPVNPIWAPRLFFADLLLDRDDKGRLMPYLPYPNPAHIAECIRELSVGGQEKPTKTVSRMPETPGFYRVIRRGFFLGDRDGLKVYRYPTRDELEIEHSRWWHSASAN
jgi:hypothetical protein